MGTRAAYWIGDPADLENREWLGCIAWDGYPSSSEGLENETTPEAFRAAVMEIAANRSDFAYPDKGWPFPWADDVFLTDCTYALIDGVVQFCWFHQPFQALADVLVADDGDDDLRDDPRHRSVPAPSAYNREQPDSIMIFRSPA